MSYYPIYLDLRDRLCLVVGAGYVGTGKIAGLMEAQARVAVIAPQASAEVQAWAAAKQIDWQQRRFVPSDVDGAFLVIAATDDKALNAEIYQLANGQQRVANAVDDLDNCNFIAPAIVKVGPVQIAVSTSGTSPALAKQLRDRIQHEILSERTEALATLLGQWRPQVKRKLPTYQVRMVFWEGILASDVPALIERGQVKAAHLSLHRQLCAMAESLTHAPTIT